jgi:hypothetical protein
VNCGPRADYPVFAPVDLVSLPNHQIYPRLMVDTIASPPFSADTVKGFSHIILCRCPATRLQPSETAV